MKEGASLETWLPQHSSHPSQSENHVLQTSCPVPCGALSCKKEISRKHVGDHVNFVKQASMLSRQSSAPDAAIKQSRRDMRSDVFRRTARFSLLPFGRLPSRKRAFQTVKSRHRRQPLLSFQPRPVQSEAALFQLGDRNRSETR